MKKSVPAESPDAYVAALDGWRRKLVETLRSATRAAGKLDDSILGAARAGGIPVLCYTVNERTAAQSLLARGVAARGTTVPLCATGRTPRAEGRSR